MVNSSLGPMTDSSAGPFGGAAGLRRNKPDWMMDPNDLGQVMVLILRRKTDAADGQRVQDESLPDSIIVGTSIEIIIGKKAARALKATREGRGTRYLLRTSSTEIIEKLTKMTELTDGTKIEIVPHPTLNTVQGIVYDPDTINKDEKSILEYLDSQGVHAVRRIQKRINGTLKNTPLLVLSFRGTILPEHVYFGLLRIQVRIITPHPCSVSTVAAMGIRESSANNLVSVCDARHRTTYPRESSALTHLIVFTAEQNTRSRHGSAPSTERKKKLFASKPIKGSLSPKQGACVPKRQKVKRSLVLFKSKFNKSWQLRIN